MLILIKKKHTFNVDHTGLKYRKISYFECNWNIHNWLGVGSEPSMIHFSRFEPDDSYKKISYKKNMY